VPLLGDLTVVIVDGRVIWDGHRPSAAGVSSDGRYVYIELGPGTHQLESTANTYYFPETGLTLRGTFKQFWDRSGGVAVFGYPLTPLADVDSIPTQYFERQRFEHHADNAGTPYEVLLGLLGTDEAVARGLLDSAPFQPAPPDPDQGCYYFAETGHNICDGFRTYWQQHGLEFGDEGISYRESVALFGFPISEEFIDPETGLTTQYFERARFEWHEENPAPFQVLLGRLGATMVDRHQLRLTQMSLVIPGPIP
jgi:hypothetical protein